MDQDPIIQKQNSAEKAYKFLKARKMAGRLALVATCMLPVADLATSDAGIAKVYQAAHHLHISDDKNTNRLAQNGIVGAAIAVESMGLGLLISKNKKIRDDFEDFENYVEEKHKTMSKPRRAISKTVNAPLKAIKFIGDKVEGLGEHVSRRKSRIARAIGNLVIDTGQVNAIGTSGVIMQETMAGNPTSLKRNARLAGLITGSWLGGAEVVRDIYHYVPYADVPLGYLGRGYETLTNVTEPVGAFAVGAVATMLAVTGWRIGKFHQEREEMLQNRPQTPLEVILDQSIIDGLPAAGFEHGNS